MPRGKKKIPMVLYSVIEKKVLVKGVEVLKKIKRIVGHFYLPKDKEKQKKVEEKVLSKRYCNEKKGKIGIENLVLKKERHQN